MHKKCSNYKCKSIFFLASLKTTVTYQNTPGKMKMTADPHEAPERENTTPRFSTTRAGPSVTAVQMTDSAAINCSNKPKITFGSWILSYHSQ
jgi:hypothetical protein